MENTEQYATCLNKGKPLLVSIYDIIIINLNQNNCVCLRIQNYFSDFIPPNVGDYVDINPSCPST